MVDPAHRELLERFVAAPEGCELLHRGEGWVYRVRSGQGLWILKVVPAHPGSERVLRAQLDWVQHLAQQGLRVPRLRSSRRGDLVEASRGAGRALLAYAYAHLPLGPESRIDWGVPGMAERLGGLIGAMHRLARGYRPPPGAPALGEWDEDDWLADPATALHPSQGAVARATVRLRDALRALPGDERTYGVVHDDLHTGNVFCLQDDLAVIDFGCCHRSWFAADIASALLFRVWIGPAREDPALQERAAMFLSELLRGYRSQAELPPGWRDMMAPLLKLREISLFQSDYRHVDLAAGEGDALCRYVCASIAEERPFLPEWIWSQSDC